MNTLIITTAALLGFSANNIAASAQTLAEFNPVAAASLSAAGVEMSFDEDGTTTQETSESGLTLTLTLKNGTPIKVSF